MMTVTPVSEANLTAAEAESLREIVLVTAGILIPASKNFELQTKLAPHLATLDEVAREQFITRLGKSSSYLQQVLNLITIGESYFFRNHPHFEALQLKILPSLIERNRATRTLRIWSAGCSTGEEPYSIAMLLDQHFPELSGWRITIRATDINTAFLDRARAGAYTGWSFRGVPDDVRARYFTVEGKNRFAIIPRIRERVQFESFNLSNPPFNVPDGDQYDLILCRNVLIYFPHELATRIILGFADSLQRGGFLLLGHSESFPTVSALETIYSNATFYYQRLLHDPADKPEPEARHSYSLVPGIAPDLPQHSYSDYLHSHASRPGRLRRRSAPHPQLHTPPPETDPTGDSTGTLIQQAEDLSTMGELDAAERILDELTASSARPDHRVFFLRAVISDQRNDTDNSLRNLKQAIFINRSFIIAHYYQGVIAEREDDSATAKRAYRNVVDLTRGINPEKKVNDGGGVTAGRLFEIATERLKELEF